MAAVPPKVLSKKTHCEAGVYELPNGAFAASLSWNGKPGTRYEESLGVKPQRWFAGVAHDLAFCARAYHAGDRQLRGVRHGRGDGEWLNFPLSCYVDQPPFWKTLETMSFGELAIKLRSSRELDKALFFGDEWQAGLGEQRLAAALKRQQQAEPQRQRQQHEPAAPARREQPASGSLPRSSSGDEPQRMAPRVGAGASAADGDAGGGGKGSKAAVPPPPPKRQDKAAAGVDQQQPQQQQAQHQRRVPAELVKTLPSSPRAARKAVAAHEAPAAAAAAVPAPAAAAAEAAQSNGGPATSSDEDLPLIARRQQPKQHHAGAAPSTAVSPGKRSPPTAAKPAGAVAAPPSPRPAKAPQPATHGQGQQEQEVQQQQVQQQQAQQQQTQQQKRPGKEAEPKTVWAKPAEFPAGSGKYPFHLKDGPLSKGYFTVANEADIVLLGRHTGTVTLRDAVTGKSWPVKASLKKTGASESRYLTATTAFNRENDLHAHDVLWLSAGEPHGQQLLFGVWRWGSPEATAFKAHLQGSGKPGSGKKRTRAQLLQEAADAAAAAGNGGADDLSEDDSDLPLIKRQQPQQQQQQQQQPQQPQPAVSSSSEDDVPLSAWRRPQATRALSPATAKAVIGELFDES